MIFPTFCQKNEENNSISSVVWPSFYERPVQKVAKTTLGRSYCICPYFENGIVRKGWWTDLKESTINIWKLFFKQNYFFEGKNCKKYLHFKQQKSYNKIDLEGTYFSRGHVAAKTVKLVIFNLQLQLQNKIRKNFNMVLHNDSALRLRAHFREKFM